MQCKACNALTTCSALVKQLHTEVTNCCSGLGTGEESAIPSMLSHSPWGLLDGVLSHRPVAAAATSFPSTQSPPPWSVGDQVCHLLSPTPSCSKLRNPRYTRDWQVLKGAYYILLLHWKKKIFWGHCFCWDGLSGLGNLCPPYAGLTLDSLKIPSWKKMAT